MQWKVLILLHTLACIVCLKHRPNDSNRRVTRVCAFDANRAAAIAACAAVGGMCIFAHLDIGHAQAMSGLATTTLSTDNPMLPSGGGSGSLFFNGLLSGAASRVVKEIALHPLDTIRARIQSKGRKKGKNDSEKYDNGIMEDGDVSLFANVYDGLIPALIGGVPGGAIFFAVKDYSKGLLLNIFQMHKYEATIISVILANAPYWLFRAPAETTKTKEQVFGSESGDGSDSSNNEKEGTINRIKAFYGSYGANFAYAVPADVVKFVTYEYLKTSFGYSGKIEGGAAAALGSLSGAISQLVATPLDVIRTRVMLGSTQGVVGTAKAIVSEEVLPHCPLR